MTIPEIRNTTHAFDGSRFAGRSTRKRIAGMALLSPRGTAVKANCESLSAMAFHGLGKDLPLGFGARVTSSAEMYTLYMPPPSPPAVSPGTTRLPLSITM
ncbi:MAG: hypothetical protein AAB092_08350 [Chloroflexota bacterium]